jgi:hypothetical protein
MEEEGLRPKRKRDDLEVVDSSEGDELRGRGIDCDKCVNYGAETEINIQTSDMIMVGVRSREETRPDTIPVVVVAMLSARIHTRPTPLRHPLS